MSWEKKDEKSLDFPLEPYYNVKRIQKENSSGSGAIPYWRYSPRPVTEEGRCSVVLPACHSWLGETPGPTVKSGWKKKDRMQRERRIFWEDVSMVYVRCDVLLFCSAFDAVENERKITPNLLIRVFLCRKGRPVWKNSGTGRIFSHKRIVVRRVYFAL